MFTRVVCVAVLLACPSILWAESPPSDSPFDRVVKAVVDAEIQRITETATIYVSCGRLSGYAVYSPTLTNGNWALIGNSIPGVTQLGKLGPEQKEASECAESTKRWASSSAHPGYGLRLLSGIEDPINLAVRNRSIAFGNSQRDSIIAVIEKELATNAPACRELPNAKKGSDRFCVSPTTTTDATSLRELFESIDDPAERGRRLIQLIAYRSLNAATDLIVEPSVGTTALTILDPRAESARRELEAFELVKAKMELVVARRNAEEEKRIRDAREAAQAAMRGRSERRRDLGPPDPKD